MKKLIIAALAFFPFITSAQNDEKTSPVKLSVGFAFSPDYSYWSVNYKNDDAVWFSDKPKEKGAFGFTTGPTILLQFSDRFSLESGLLFSDKATITEVHHSDSKEIDLPVSSKYKSHSLFLDVPVKANVYLTDSKLKLFLSAGPAANFFLNEKRIATDTYADGRTVERSSWGSTGVPVVSLTVLGGIGADYEISDNLKLRVEPVYRRNVSLADNPIFRSHLVSYGLNLGVFMKL